MKTVFISGICGFLGQNLSRAFLKKGWIVHGIDDLSVGTKDWLPDIVEFEESNACGYEFPRYLKCDLVVHLATKKIPREGNSFDVLHDNIAGVMRIAAAAMTIGSKFIYLSTSDIYGKNTNFSETSDSVIGHPTVPRWSYAISKMWGEQFLYSTPPDFNFNIVRLFGTYGPYHSLSWRAGPQSVFISQALKNESLTIHGDGYQQRAFQYVDDAVDGIMRIVKSDYKREIFNIGNPYDPIMITWLAEKIWYLINPKKCFKRKHIPHSKFKYEEIQARIPDISRAERLLGFDPKIGLDEGLAKTIEWQKGVV